MYISRYGDKYCVRKSVNGNVEYFGVYNTMKEAIEMRDKLIKNNWDKHIVPVKKYLQKNRYIVKRTDKEGNVFYEITKRIEGNYTYFGRFKDIEQAIEERDFLEQNEWDYENICSQ